MLIGRMPERRMIDGLVAGARLGRSGVLVLTGEAGIGKTTLLGYARETARDLRLLQAVGTEAEQDVPFGGLAQLLRASERDLARIPPPQAQALGVALALREGRIADRLTVGAAVLSLLVRWSEDAPLGVLIDDAHLLDRPSAEALAFAGRRFLADAVFVLAAARSGTSGPLTSSGLPGLVVTGLDVEATRALVADRVRTPGPERAGQLHRATGGNPLAVLELLRHPDQPLVPAPGHPLPPVVPVPAALAEAFGGRVAGLSEEARDLLLLAAIGGADLALLSRAVETDGPSGSGGPGRSGGASGAGGSGGGLAALAEAERAELVRVDGDRVEFTHPLIRSAVHAAAFPDQRRAAHSRIAAVLPADDRDRRAWHLGAAALGPDAEVASALDEVGRRAQTRGAHAVAAAAFERSARLTPDAETSGETAAERLLLAARAAWSAGDGPWAERLADEADRSAAGPRLRAMILALRGDVALRDGRSARARALYLDAAAALADLDPSEAVLLVADAVNAGFYAGSAAASLEAASRIEDLVDRGVSTGARAVGAMAVGLARILAGLPGKDELRSGATLLESVPADERGDVRPAWFMYGPLMLRESGSVRDLVRTVLDEVRAQSAVSSLPLLLFTIARDGAATDRWAAAEADYGEATALSRELGDASALAMNLAGMSWLAARQGRVEECRQTAEETLARCAEQPVNLARVWAEFALGELALSRGEVEDAAARLGALQEHLVEIDLRDPDVSPAPELVEALLRTGRREEAERHARAYAAAAELKGQPWALARTARLHGLLGAAEELDDRFAEALALHGRTPDVFEVARTRLVHGSCLLRARRRVDARVQLRAALEIFERLGARIWADVAAAELEATGQTIVRGEVGAAEHLTPRELQIGLLLAEGRTTREAAAALFLSPKTVEYHLRHVYTKLDITSRAELVERLADAAG